MKKTRRIHTRIPGYTPEVEAAKELSVTVRTLRKWRKMCIGPPYVEVARLFHYPDEARRAWLKSKEVQPVRSSRSDNKHHSETGEASA